MKKTPMLCAIAVAALFSAHAEAIYKCTTAKGVVYQDRPCREGTETDVTIVIPTGELAPKAVSASDDAGQGNAPRTEGRFGAAQRSGRPADEGASVTKGADRRAGAETAGADDSGKKSTRQTIEKVVPMTAEQARQADATAKYYTTDAASSGAETPEHMTCESPSGEKRKFTLTNGKLTSI